MSYYFAYNNALLLNNAAKRMNLDIIVLSETSQTEKDKYDITYMWKLKCDTNELIYKIETDSQT